MNKRSYRQNCSLARAADVIGERWTLLLIRDLLIGPRRYKDLFVSLRGIGTNLLATRLKDLEAADIVARVGAGRGGHAYVLTEAGRALETTVLSLIRWGLMFGPAGEDGFHQREEWDLVALKALFQPSRAADLSVTVHFKAPEFSGWLSVRDRNATIGSGDSAAVDIVVAATIKQLFIDSDAPDALLTSGSADELRRFMSAFALRA